MFNSQLEQHLDNFQEDDHDDDSSSSNDDHVKPVTTRPQHHERMEGEEDEELLMDQAPEFPEKPHNYSFVGDLNLSQNNLLPLLALPLFLFSFSFLDKDYRQYLTSIGFCLLLAERLLPMRSERIHTSLQEERHELHQELSRLMGLVGAPPLLPLSTASPDSPQLESTTILKFTKSHVQFLLTIDQVYDWLSHCTSIHLGLGPQSQCVERVERSMAAKQQNMKLVPQSHTRKCILCLSTVRLNVAKSLVAQLESLLSIWKALRPSDEDSHADYDPLEIPAIITLSWIKDARHEIAILLSQILQSTVNTSQVGYLDESSSLAETSMRHLRAQLLLDDKTDATNHSFQKLPRDDKGLTNLLLQYQKHLEALQAAVWGCRHMESSSSLEVTASTSDSNDGNFSQRQEWWVRIQNLNCSLQAIQDEIEQQYFLSEIEVERDHKEDMSSGTGQQPMVEVDRYEHDEVPTASGGSSWSKPQRESTKTVVFTGQGEKAEQAHRAKAPSLKQPGTKGPSAHPPARSFLSEQQLAKELQERVRALVIEEEGDPEEMVPQNTKSAKEHPSSLFLGASGSLLQELKLSLPVGTRQEAEALGDDENFGIENDLESN